MNNFTQIKDFHGERSKGVGSSDIPIILGMTKHYSGGGVKTPLDLWEAKTGRADRWKGNQKTFFGNELEPIICGAFIGRHFKNYKGGKHVKLDKIRGDKLTNFNEGIAHHNTEARMKDYPWALAHADMIIESDKEGVFIVEAKSHSFFAAQRKDDASKGYDKKSTTADAVPLAIWCQAQWQMMCYDIPIAYVAPLIDTNDFRIFGPIKSEPRRQEMMLAKARLFWDCVVEDKPPKPETWGDALKIFPERSGETVIIGGADMDKALEMKSKAKDLRKVKAKVKKELDEIKTSIGLLLGSGDVLTDPEGKKIASRSCFEKEGLPLKTLKENDWIYSRVKKYITKTIVNKLNF